MEAGYVKSLQEKILSDILDERGRQDLKWGNQYHHKDSLWALILGEESGEVQKAALERNFAELREELIQVAAVAVQWVEALDHRQDKTVDL